MPHTVDDLKIRVHQENETVPSEMLETAVCSFQERIKIYVELEGRQDM